MIRNIIILSTCILLICPLSANAQGNDQVGLRLGSTNTVLYKHYLDENRALEARFGMNRKDRVVKLLFQYEQPASLLYREKLIFYYGFGLHTGFQRNKDFGIIPDPGIPRLFPALGFDAVVGSEFRLSVLPVSLGIDLNPSFEIFAPFGFWRKLLDFGITIKYMI